MVGRRWWAELRSGAGTTDDDRRHPALPGGVAATTGGWDAYPGALAARADGGGGVA